MNRIFEYEIIRNQKLNVMKSFNLVSPPYYKLFIVAAIILFSMAFRNPYTPLPEANNYQKKTLAKADTIPQNDFNINIDVSKILAEVDIALSKIDFEKIAKDVELSLKKIDFTKIQKDIDASLKSIDWEKMNKDIKNSLNKIDNKKIQIQIQKSIQDAKKQMNSKEFKQSMQKLKEININELREELKKAKIETEKSRKDLQKELQKMKAEADKKDAVLLNNFGIEKTVLILI